MSDTIINILVLNWNSSSSVKDCLDSLMLSGDSCFRVILIDNGSEKVQVDELVEYTNYLRRQCEIHLVLNESNLGYAGGNNSGYKYLIKFDIPGDILILNPDVKISYNTISEMRLAMDADVGIVSARTVNSKMVPLYDAIRLNGFFQKRLISNLPIIESDYAQGSCMLIKRALVDKIGLFDEQFFLYWEEVDFSIRAKKNGYRIISTTRTSIVRSDNSKTRLPTMFYYSVRNSKLIREKHIDLFPAISYYLYLGYIFVLILKNCFRPSRFKKLIRSYYFGISDSNAGRYYIRSSARPPF
jgi:GT2 family glycosyltransferase